MWRKGRKHREWDGWETVYRVMRRQPESDSPVFDTVIAEHRCRWVAVLLARVLNRLSWEPCYYVAVGKVRRQEQGGDLDG